jgi:formylglycine-generating enzyme required for sulfatase activity
MKKLAVLVFGICVFAASNVIISLPVDSSSLGREKMKKEGANVDIFGIKLVHIKAGEFKMGSPALEKDRNENEKQHRVKISRDFWMGRYEVTQVEYLKIMGRIPRGQASTGLPVASINWNEAMEFCKKVNEKAEGLPQGYEIRLPTEAEWEYCCRAGTETATAYGNSLSSDQANFDGKLPYGGAVKGKYVGTITKVGSYKPNNWGIYDMHGNVWEWCLDLYDADETYKEGIVDPLCKKGSNRVLRGGSWEYDGSYCRSAYRYDDSADRRSNIYGFRVCLAPSPKPDK